VNPANTQHTVRYDEAADKLQDETVKAAKEGPASVTGMLSFAGLTDTFFAAVLLPETAGAVEQVTFSDLAPTPLDKTPVAMIGSGVGTGVSNRFTMFVGPKDLQILRAVNPKLDQVVDFGLMKVLAKPLFQLVNLLNSTYVHNFGWSIVLITVAINLALFPLRVSSMKSMRRMQALQPQINAINDKYKGIGFNDPKKADQNQEVMDLYKKHGVNPLGGCMPMLLQLPFFFAFYKVFTVSVEMRGATWLWVTDLSQPEHMVIRILPLVMIVSQFFMQQMTPQPAGGDPTQQKLMKFMPLIFGYMFWYFPSGLVLYYLTSNLVGILLQWFFNHTAAAEEAVRSVQVKKKDGRK
jgi:YidC/Oxa1 family membrane protein insertase